MEQFLDLFQAIMDRGVSDEELLEFLLLNVPVAWQQEILTMPDVERIDYFDPSLKITELKDNELLAYLLAGYSLEQLLRDDIQIRMDMEQVYLRQNTPDILDREYWYEKRNIYAEYKALANKGDYSFMYRTFDRKEMLHTEQIYLNNA